MKPSDILYAVATGPERRRKVLTPVGLIVFFGLLVVLVSGSLFTDRVQVRRKLQRVPEPRPDASSEDHAP